MKTAAAFAVLALSLVACGGAKPPAVAPADVAAALCVAKVVREAGDPRALAPEAAVALALRVGACLPKAPPAPVAADAGALASDGGR
jgi:hypothetical protein